MEEKFSKIYGVGYSPRFNVYNDDLVLYNGKETNVKVIDEYHFQINGFTYHTHEFAEKNSSFTLIKYRFRNIPYMVYDLINECGFFLNPKYQLRMSYQNQLEKIYFDVIPESVKGTSKPKDLEDFVIRYLLFYNEEFKKCYFEKFDRYYS